MSSARLGTGTRALLVGACSIVVIAGLKSSAEIVVPVLVAIFVALPCVPLVAALQRRGVPNWAAVPVAFLLALVVLVLLSLVVGRSINQFRESLDPYYQSLQLQLAEPLAWIASTARDLGMDLSVATLRDKFDTKRVFDWLGDATGAIANLLSNTLFVVLTVMFFLAEAAGFPAKLREAFGGRDTAFGQSARAALALQEYLRIKTLTSLATGVLAGLLVWAFGIDYPLLWALAAFALNYVPTIGSMLAALPPILLAFVQPIDPGSSALTRTLLVGGGYVAINMIIGNLVEPKLMGRKLGLSSLVVFLSLVFWGWVLGPVGMLLSVPLTMVVKILLENSSDLRWAGVLLGPGGEDTSSLVALDDELDRVAEEAAAQAERAERNPDAESATADHDGRADEPGA